MGSNPHTDLGTFPFAVPGINSGTVLNSAHEKGPASIQEPVTRPEHSTSIPGLFPPLPTHNRINPCDRRSSLQNAYRAMRLTKEASPYCHKMNQTKERTNQLAADLKTTRLGTKRLSGGLSKPDTDTNPPNGPSTVPITIPHSIPEIVPGPALEKVRKSYRKRSPCSSAARRLLPSYCRGQPIVAKPRPIDPHDHRPVYVTTHRCA